MLGRTGTCTHGNSPARLHRVEYTRLLEDALDFAACTHVTNEVTANAMLSVSEGDTRGQAVQGELGGCAHYTFGCNTRSGVFVPSKGRVLRACMAIRVDGVDEMDGHRRTQTDTAGGKVVGDDDRRGRRSHT